MPNNDWHLESQPGGLPQLAGTPPGLLPDSWVDWGGQNAWVANRLIPRMAQSAYNALADAVSLPGQVARGQVNPQSEEGQRRALNLATTVAAGGYATPGKPVGSLAVGGSGFKPRLVYSADAPVVDNALKEVLPGSTAESRAWSQRNEAISRQDYAMWKKLQDTAVPQTQAEQMLANGTSPAQVHRETGWYQDPDDKWWGYTGMSGKSYISKQRELAWPTKK